MPVLHRHRLARARPAGVPRLRRAACAGRRGAGRPDRQHLARGEAAGVDATNSVRAGAAFRGRGRGRAARRGSPRHCRSAAAPGRPLRRCATVSACSSNGSSSCCAPSRSMLDTANPTSVRPRSAISGAAAATRPRAVARMTSVDAVARGIVCDRVARPKSSNRKPQHHRSAGAAGLAHPPGDPVDEVDDDGVDLRRPTSCCRPGRAPAARRPSGAAPPSPHGGDRCCATTRTADGPSRRRPSTPSVDSLSSATSATVSMPCACSFSAVLTPTPHSRRTGSGCRNASSRSGGTSSRPSGLASWLATLARNLVRAMPTVIGSPTRSRTCARSRAAISTGVPDTRRRPRHVEEGLVHRQRFDHGRGVAEHLEHRVAGLASTPTSAAAPRSRADTARGPGVRPSRCARRRPWPRSWPRARRRRRRSPAGRAARDRHAARPTRRTSRGQRAGCRRLSRRIDLAPDTNICSHRGPTSQRVWP